MCVLLSIYIWTSLEPPLFANKARVFEQSPEDQLAHDRWHTATGSPVYNAANVLHQQAFVIERKWPTNWQSCLHWRPRD